MPGIWETHMTFSQRSRTLFKTLAVMLALALPTALVISSADARVGGGMSSGSRGSRTYSAPPSTTTAPGSTSQFNRTYTQPGAGMNSAAAAPARGGLFGRAGGFMGALRPASSAQACSACCSAAACSVASAACRQSLA